MRIRLNKQHFGIEITSFMIMLVVLFLSIAYSAFSINLNVDEISALVRVKKDIRITNIVPTNMANNAVSSYEEYDVSRINSNISLPNSNSSVTYNIAITNIGNVEMGILNISGLPSNLKYSISNYNLKDVLCDSNDTTKCKLGAITTLVLTIEYAENGYNINNTDYEIILEFDFRRVYQISYTGFSSVSGLPTSILEDESKTITFSNTNGIPYDVDVENATGSYSSPTLTLSNASNNVAINRYYHINYILNGGTNSNSNPDKFLATDNITLVSPSYSGNTFEGWYDNGGFTGSVITNIQNRNSDITLYAKWAADVIAYNISYVLNGGTQANNQVTSFYLSNPQTILAPTNTHDATFGGWYQNSGFTGDEITSTSQLSGNTTLNAKWESNIANTTFSTATNRFTASGVSGVSLRNFTATGSYEYTQNSANTTINSVKVYVTYSSSNKTATVTCQVNSGTARTTSISLNTGQNNAIAEGTISMGTAIQPGSSYTVSCTSFTGDNNGKVKINGFEFLINP